MSENQVSKIMLRVDENLRKKLEKIARENGVSISDVVLAAANHITEEHEKGTLIIKKETKEENMRKSLNMERMAKETGISESRIHSAFLSVDTICIRKTLEDAMENYRKAKTENDQDIAIKEIAIFFEE